MVLFSSKTQKKSIMNKLKYSIDHKNINLGTHFSSNIFRGYIDESDESKKIFDLLRDCNVDNLIKELTVRGISFNVLKEKQKRLYISITYEGKYYHVKIHNFVKEPRLNKIVGNLLYPSQAKRSWVAARQFIDMGLPTPMPLGYLEKRRIGVLLSSIFVTEYIREAMKLRDIYAGLYNREDKKALIINLARFVAMLHSKGIFHGDLKASNILARRDGTGKIHFYITDLASLKFKHTLSAGEIARDIACLNTSFGNELPIKERLRFLFHYYRSIKGFKLDRNKMFESIQIESLKREQRREYNNAKRVISA